MSRKDFVAALTKSGCEALTPCCSGSGFNGVDSTCGVAFERMGFPEQIDGAAADDCIKRVTELATKQCSLHPAEVKALCTAAFGGPKPTGEECADNGDCQSGVCYPGNAQSSFVTGPSICREVVAPTPGAPCVPKSGSGFWAPKSAKVAECTKDPTLFCDQSTATCVARLDAGVACDRHTLCKASLGCRGTCQPAKTGDPCKFDLECQEKDRCEQGKCVAKKVQGEACTSSDQCAGSWCAKATGKCDTWAHALGCVTTKP